MKAVIYLFGFVFSVVFAESNRIIAQSITPELIQMTEAQARLKHGWVTVTGAESVVVDDAG